MPIPTRIFWILLAVAIVAVVSAFILINKRSNQLLDRGATGSSFPRYTVEPDGSISKDLPTLSTTSITRIPSRQMKQLVFGINPVVLETNPSSSTDVERVVFTIENKPSDILKEYQEYFDALGWPYTSPENSLGLVWSAKDARTTIDIASRASGGSMIAIVRSQQR